MKQVHTNGSSGFTHYTRQGKEIVVLPPNVQPRQIDITRLHPRDLREVLEYRLCEMMATAGFSYKAIMHTLGLTMGETTQRVRRCGIRVKDYRDGTSPLAKEIINRLDAVAQRKVYDRLSQYILK